MSRNPVQIERDREIITRLIVSGEYISRIPVLLQEETGEKYLLSRPQIHYEVNKIKKDWQTRNESDVDQVKNEQLEKLNAIELEYWRAWRKSTLPRRTRTTKAKLDPDAKNGQTIQEQTQRVEEYPGNPEFLRGVERCIDMRLRLAGLLEDTAANFYQFNFNTPKSDVDKIDPDDVTDVTFTPIESGE